MVKLLFYFYCTKSNYYEIFLIMDYYFRLKFNTIQIIILSLKKKCIYLVQKVKYARVKIFISFFSIQILRSRTSLLM